MTVTMSPPRTHAASRRRPRSGRHRAALVAWLFLAPALVLFLYFKFIPIFVMMRDSFYEVRPFLGDRFLGLENYRTVVTDPAYTSAIWHSAVLAVGATAGSILLGLLLALVVEGPARSLWFVRTAAFLPVVTTIAAVAEVWRIMYHPAGDGLINSILGWVGLGPSPFLASEDTSLWSIMGMMVWRGAPYDMMIFVAGLVGVDRTLYEAAAVDGATTWQRFRTVTLPALRPVFWILLTLAAIRGLRVFVEVYVMTNGGPNGSSEVLMTMIYKEGFQNSRLGLASAGSCLLFLATLLLTLIVQGVRRRQAR